jgi:hypothetical protein
MVLTLGLGIGAKIFSSRPGSRPSSPRGGKWPSTPRRS